jgi:peptidoglycan LD-endopeptidase LytH
MFRRARLWFWIAAFVVVAAFPWDRVLNDPRFERMWAEITLPYRILRLQAEPADEQLAYPVQGVRRVADTWGAPRPGDRKHQGQDLFARKGTPVVAAARGYVVRIADSGLGGKHVFVAGAGSRNYYYAHLDRFAEGLHVGQFVAVGDRIGYVGNTGNARTTPPHLHFGIYGPGGAINPYPLLTAEGD